MDVGVTCAYMSCEIVLGGCVSEYQQLCGYVGYLYENIPYMCIHVHTCTYMHVNFDGVVHVCSVWDVIAVCW